MANANSNKGKTAAKAPAKAEEKKDLPVKQSGGAVTGAKLDTTGMIVTGDKADLSHIKQSQRGNENVGVEDLAIPRLEVVQGLSEALKVGQPGYIEGAKQGDLINSVTNTNYGREVFVVPIFFSKQWLVWKLYTEGGGFFGAFNTPAEAEARLEEAVEEGNKREHLEIIDTPVHLCLLVDHRNSTVAEVMVPLSKTKAKVSRAWNTMIRMAGVDRFARVYRLTTALEKNKKNQEYWNFVVAQAGAPNPVLYAAAEKLFNQMAKGERTVVMDTKGMQGGDDHANEESDM